MKLFPFVFTAGLAMLACTQPPPAPAGGSVPPPQTSGFVDSNEPLLSLEERIRNAGMWITKDCTGSRRGSEICSATVTVVELFALEADAKRALERAVLQVSLRNGGNIGATLYERSPHYWDLMAI